MILSDEVVTLDPAVRHLIPNQAPLPKLAEKMLCLSGPRVMGSKSVTLSIVADGGAEDDDAAAADDEKHDDDQQLVHFLRLVETFEME